jgi:hypothetical protein
MANQLSGQTGPSPRAYSRHQRTRKFARVKSGADQFSAFLAAQATRLSSTSAAVFAKLPKNTAARIKLAGSLGSLS